MLPTRGKAAGRGSLGREAGPGLPLTSVLTQLSGTSPVFCSQRTAAPRAACMTSLLWWCTMALGKLSVLGAGVRGSHRRWLQFLVSHWFSLYSLQMGAESSKGAECSLWDTPEKTGCEA